ncbi:GroES-like protein [Hypoxylon sp. FL1857]|nr:GroES-like protein [Hypoxylon sp. FL1857]
MATSSSPPIPAEMKAIQVTAYNEPYKLNTVPVPTLGPRDLLVKVAVASYCHTDGMVASGVFHTRLPVTASHEGAGTIVAIGTEVKPSHFKPGDRVMCGLPLHPCGHVGVHIDGCFAEYVRVDERFTTKLPDEVRLRDAAPLACAGRTIWRGVKMADLKAGEWLAIIGSGGGLGHLGVQFAKAMGVNVLGIDARGEGLRVSSECGADVVVDARKGKAEVVGQVQSVTGGEGAHAAIVLADAEGATALAAAVTRMHGTVVQLAQPDEVKIPFQEFVFRDIRFRGSMLCSPEESREMVRFIAEHTGKGGSGIKVETTAFEGLERIEELMKLIQGQSESVCGIMTSQIHLIEQHMLHHV